MPYYSNINVLFLHIPKTGGTVIEEAIQKKTKQTLYSGYSNDLLPSPFNIISLQHQLYTTLYKYKHLCGINFDRVKIFAVVRNPYDRIISDLFFLRLIHINTSAEDVYHIIKDNYLYRDNLDNHNIPQFKFISDENGDLVSNIKIFKTETLNENNKLLNEYLGIDINIITHNVNKNYSKYLNKNSINIINTFYRKDFELFNYHIQPTF
tara:strand:- start:1248 stop:1871 length:624 start_codon:yes stop_codon:yes gene_type:complete